MREYKYMNDFASDKERKEWIATIEKKIQDELPNEYWKVYLGGNDRYTRLMWEAAEIEDTDIVADEIASTFDYKDFVAHFGDDALSEIEYESYKDEIYDELRIVKKWMEKFASEWGFVPLRNDGEIKRNIMKRSQDSLQESSLSNLHRYLEKGDVIFITAQKDADWIADHYDGVRDTNGNISTKKVVEINRERNIMLQHNLHGLWYSFFMVDGSYENSQRKDAYVNQGGDINNKKAYTDTDRSFAVISNGEESAEFIEKLLKLAKRYNQESILFVEKGTMDGIFYYTDGRQPEAAGSSHFGTDSPFKSLVGGIRPFVVEDMLKNSRISGKHSPHFKAKSQVQHYLSERPDVMLENSNKYRRVKRALFGDPTGKIKTFAVISSENPLGLENATEEEAVKRYTKWLRDRAKYNDESIEEMEEILLDNGEKGLKMGRFNYVKIKGYFGELEHSFIIFNIPYEDAEAIARNFGQLSFFYGKTEKDGSIVSYYVSTNNCFSYKHVETSRTIVYADEATDYFSKYGFKYRISMQEFGDDVIPIVDEHEFEESFNPNGTFMSRALHRIEALGLRNMVVNPKEIRENSNRYRRLKRTLFGDNTGKIKTFAIISAMNPLGFENATDEEAREKFSQWSSNKNLYNKKAKEEMRRIIQKNGDTAMRMGHFDYVDIYGMYDNAERSFFIFNIPFVDAESLAKSYGQESFFYGKILDGKTQIAYYKTDDACKSYHRVGITDTVSLEDKDAEDFFSKYGFKFRINMQAFGDDVRDIENEYEFEESFSPELTFMSRAMHRRRAYKNKSY